MTLGILGSTLLITMTGETMCFPRFLTSLKNLISRMIPPHDSSSYLISGAVATPIAGKLSDIYGRKRLVITIMIIYIFGISWEIFTLSSFLVIARVIQGVVSSMFPIAFWHNKGSTSEQKLAIGVGILAFF